MIQINKNMWHNDFYNYFYDGRKVIYDDLEYVVIQAFLGTSMGELRQILQIHQNMWDSGLPCALQIRTS